LAIAGTPTLQIMGMLERSRDFVQRRVGEAWRLGTSYADKPAVSFTDLTAMVIMRRQACRDGLI